MENIEKYNRIFHTIYILTDQNAENVESALKTNQMTHRFILEPYKGVASRHTCPECNHNRCFSRYIDTENVVSFPEYVGRCDREQKCGYHFTPKEYFEQKRITDQNEKLRSTKVCMGLTKKYGLYIASGKENVKEHRLKEPDKTKYEIFHALQSAIPKCRNWQQLQMELQKSGITIDLRKNGNTEQIQGVRFEKAPVRKNQRVVRL